MRPASSTDCNININIIIVNHNASAFLARCVASIHAVATQIIVVDNDPHDDSLALLEQAIPQNERLRIIRTGRNLGFSAGCNVGIAASTAEHLLFLNPDCVLQPGSLQRLLGVLQSDSTIGMVGGLLTSPDGTEQAGARRAVPTPWRSFVSVFGLTRFAARWPKLFLIFISTSSLYPLRPLKSRPFPGPACWSGVKQ